MDCGEKLGTNLFSNPKSLYYLYKIIRYGTQQITSTSNAYNETANLADSSNSHYFRFSVPPVEGARGHDGLASIRIVDCLKRPRKGVWIWVKKKATAVGNSAVVAGHWLIGRRDTWKSEEREPPEKPEWYTKLQKEASAGGQRHRKGHFKPEKYESLTYDTIFDRTREYYERDREGDPESVQEKLDDCARKLLGRMRWYGEV